MEKMNPIAIAIAYEKLKHNPTNAKVIEAYAQFNREIVQQFDTLPIDVIFTDENPYETSKEMFDDILNNDTLRVFSGGEPHELMSENLKFRAIHDFYGHFVNRNTFSYKGETKAYEQHSKMFSPLANKALFTETIGQNSWFNYSPCNIGKPNSEKQFAEQKAGLII